MDKHPGVGLGVYVGVQSVAIALKLSGYTQDSWLWVLFPTCGPILIVITLILIEYINHIIDKHF